MNSLTRGQRLILRVALAWFLLSLLGLIVTGPPPWTLTSSQSPQEFCQALVKGWAEPSEALHCGLGSEYVPTPEEKSEPPDFQRLRVHLLIDSAGFVPGYVALLLFFTLYFSSSLWIVLRQSLCFPAVAAGLFDIAENSMLASALDDLLQSSLADPTVDDVASASGLKWWLLGAALAVLACRVATASSKDRPWILAAAIAGGLAALLFVLGAAFTWRGATQGAMIAAFATILLLTWRVCKAPAGATIVPGATAVDAPTRESPEQA